MVVINIWENAKLRQVLVDFNLRKNVLISSGKFERRENTNLVKESGC